MPRSKPYLPLVLRLVHNINAVIAVLAVLTSYWVYDNYDGRWGKLSLPRIPDIIGIHGTFGLILLFVMPALAVYSFHTHAGQQRLIKPDSFNRLRQLGKPIWWYSLHRITNTAMLLAVVFALVSGSMIQEKWLFSGKLMQPWYLLHLTSWVLLVFCLAIHLLMSAKVGGLPLLVAMFELKYRSQDSPSHWSSQIRSWLHRPHL